MAIYSPWGINHAWAAAGAAAGGLTLSLAHFNGTDAATDTTDDVSSVIWTLAGGAQLDTAQKQFGSASLLIPAAGGGGASTISTPVPLLGTSDWTVEYFLRVVSGTFGFIREQETAPTFNSCVNFAFQADTDPFDMSLQVATGGSVIETLVSGDNLALDTWIHIAAVREGTAYSFYTGGVRRATATNATNIGTGVRFNMTEAYGFDLWVDELRISQVARYTGASFTPPSAEFTLD